MSKLDPNRLYLHGHNEKPLSWKDRLRIALKTTPRCIYLSRSITAKELGTQPTVGKQKPKNLAHNRGPIQVELEQGYLSFKKN